MNDNIIYVYTNEYGRRKSLKVEWNNKTNGNKYHYIMRDLATSEICSSGYAIKEIIVDFLNQVKVTEIF